MPGSRPLSDFFRAAGGAGPPSEPLERALAAVLEEARRAWPALEIDERTFVGHLARHTPGDAEPAAWVAGLHAGDLYLACGCADGDERAIEAFEEQYLATVGEALASRGAPADAVDEVRQALRVRLLVKRDAAGPRIAEYGGRGALAKWLRVTALRELMSLRRLDVAREQRRAKGPPPDVAGADPELALIREKYAGEFNAALREAFDALSAQQRHALRLQFLDGLNLAEAARALGVSRATAGRTVLAAREELFAQTTGLLRARLQLDDQELASLLRVVRSGLEMSLRSVLATRG